MVNVASVLPVAEWEPSEGLVPSAAGVLLPPSMWNVWFCPLSLSGSCTVNVPPTEAVSSWMPCAALAMESSGRSLVPVMVTVISWRGEAAASVAHIDDEGFGTGFAKSEAVGIGISVVDGIGVGPVGGHCHHAIGGDDAGHLRPVRADEAEGKRIAVGVGAGGPAGHGGDALVEFIAAGEHAGFDDAERAADAEGRRVVGGIVAAQAAPRVALGEEGAVAAQVEPVKAVYTVDEGVVGIFAEASAVRAGGVCRRTGCGHEVWFVQGREELLARDRSAFDHEVGHGVLGIGRIEITQDNGAAVVETENKVIAGTYHVIDSTPVGPWGVLMAVMAGFYKSAKLIFMIMFCGGAVAVLEKSGSINAAFGRLASNKKLNAHVLALLIMAFMSVGGAAGVFANPVVALVPIGIILATSLGYDAFTGFLFVYMGAYSGFNVGWANATTIGVAHPIAELPIFSGFEVRVLLNIINFAICYFFTVRYMKRSGRIP